MVKYVGVKCRPDVCLGVQIIVPGAVPTISSDLKTMKKVLLLLKKEMEEGLDYMKLDMDRVRIGVLTDAYFANAKGLKSQLGYLILMDDKMKHENIVHLGSSR